MDESAAPINLAPFQQGSELKGFIVNNRWPSSTLEWMQTLIAVVRVACIPGMLPQSTVFEVREEVPDGPIPTAVGVVFAVGPVSAQGTLTGATFRTAPPALLMVHPPCETRPSLAECPDTATGTILLPGLPHLGLEHRAGWAETEIDGTVVGMRARSGVDPIDDPDTAVLAMLLAA